MGAKRLKTHCTNTSPIIRKNTGANTEHNGAYRQRRRARHDERESLGEIAAVVPWSASARFYSRRRAPAPTARRGLTENGRSRRKYFSANRPCRASNGAPQLRHASSRLSATVSASTYTTSYTALQFGQLNRDAGDDAITELRRGVHRVHGRHRGPNLQPAATPTSMPKAASRNAAAAPTRRSGPSRPRR